MDMVLSEQKVVNTSNTGRCVIDIYEQNSEHMNNDLSKVYLRLSEQFCGGVVKAYFPTPTLVLHQPMLG